MHARQPAVTLLFSGLFWDAAVVCRGVESLEQELQQVCAGYCRSLGVQTVSGSIQPMQGILQQPESALLSMRQDLPADSPVLEFARYAHWVENNLPFLTKGWGIKFHKNPHFGTR